MGTKIKIRFHTVELTPEEMKRENGKHGLSPPSTYRIAAFASMAACFSFFRIHGAQRTVKSTRDSAGALTTWWGWYQPSAVACLFAVTPRRKPARSAKSWVR